jgi:hypothetical protein
MTDIENKLLKLSKEYETLEEKCNETGVKWIIIKTKYEELKKKLSDTGNLANIKQTIQKLNTENISLDIKIGIINHSILKHKLNAGHNFNNIEGIDSTVFDEILWYELNY